jgi:hypothetical protein
MSSHLIKSPQSTDYSSGYRLYDEAKAGILSLIKQLACIFVVLLAILLGTGGNISAFVLGFSFCIGTAWVAWSEHQRLTTSSYLSTPVNLNQWFEHKFDLIWQTPQDVLGLGVPIRTRQNQPINLQWQIIRCKSLQLGWRHRLALIVCIRQESAQYLVILVRVRPVGKKVYLPAKLQLIVLDQSGKVFANTQPKTTGHRYHWIEQQFTLFRGENFKVKLILNNTSVTELFLNPLTECCTNKC